MSNDTRVAIVGSGRTPFAKAGTVLKEHTALDLGVHAVDGTLGALDLDPEAVDQFAFGIVTLDARIPHLAREVNLQSVLPARARSITITDNCITGLTAIESVGDAIAARRIETGLAGGVESMSNPSVLWGRRATRTFADLQKAKGLSKLRTIGRLRPSDFAPRLPGVKEPSTGLSMGEHTEITVKEWGISRREQDEFALASHLRAAAATEAGYLPAEIVPLSGRDRDGIIRPTTSMEALERLSPVFDTSGSGSLTAGNSSPLTDGAAVVVMMSEGEAENRGMEPLAFVKDMEFAAIDPSEGLLMAPGVAVPRLLERLGMTLDEFDLIEMHEAFGGQVAANLAAWEHGWKYDPIGKVDRDRLNVNGGSIAIGHPFAATGARIAGQLANEMVRRGAQYGLMSVCGAGGTAGAMVLERD